MAKTTVFITYAHESDSHKTWVRQLAHEIAGRSVRVILDQHEMDYGDSIPEFMETAVRQASHILFICTPGYGRKASAGEGGVGYEQALIIGRLLAHQTAPQRLIPLLRSGEPSVAIPAFLHTRLFIDFRDDHQFATNVQQLKRSLGNASFNGRVAKGRSSRAKAGIDTRSALRLRVLVAGTGIPRRMTKKERESARLLGRCLAERDFGLVTGGWSGVDEIVAEEFARSLGSKRPLEDHLSQFVVLGHTPAFDAGALYSVRKGDEEWIQPVRESDAVVLIGGLGGTWTTGETALAEGKVVVPVLDTERDAHDFYLHMVKEWHKIGEPKLTDADLIRVGGEAPQVVRHIPDFLDRAFRTSR